MSKKNKKHKIQAKDSSKDRKLLKNIIIALLLCGLVVGAGLFKVAKIKNNEHFDPDRPGSLFYSETAFHYRYAEIVATENNPLQIIRNDTFVQYPETIDALKYYTIMMEFVCGYVYRIINFGLPFNLFLIYFTCFLSSLPLIIVYLIAKRLFGNDFVAVGASLFYLSTPMGYARMLTGPFLREDFALVFLLLSLWMIIILFEQERRPVLGVVTGLTIVFSLSSWHFSQFVYICTLPFFFWLFACRPDRLKNFLIPVIILFVAGFVVPVLKTRIFITSLLCALPIAWWQGIFCLAYAKKLCRDSF